MGGILFRRVRRTLAALGVLLSSGGVAQAQTLLLENGALRELRVPYVELAFGESRHAYAVSLTSTDLDTFVLDPASVRTLALSAPANPAHLALEGVEFVLHLPRVEVPAQGKSLAVVLRSNDLQSWRRSTATPLASSRAVSDTPHYFKWCMLTGATGVRGEDFAWLWINNLYDLATGSTWTEAGYTCPDRNKYTGYSSKGVTYKSCAKWKNTTETGAPLGIVAGPANLVHGVYFDDGTVKGSLSFTSTMGQKGCNDGLPDDAANCYHLFVNPDTDTNLCSCGSPVCQGGYTFPSTYLSFGGPARGGSPVSGTPSSPRAADSGCAPTLGGGTINTSAYGLAGTYTPRMVYWEVTPTTECVAPGATRLRGTTAKGPVN